MYNPYAQNPYDQPFQQEQGGKKKWTKGDWLVKVIIPISVPLLAALIAAGYFATKPAPTIQVLSHSYTGSMIRDNDGARFDLTLNQVNENQSGDFTASAVINGCPSAVSGSVKDSGSISFTADESTACQDKGGIVTFTGNVQSDKSMSGRWSANTDTVQVVGSWSQQ
ncbi:MAG TPA: hypothetical protein VEP90_07755 [Methylomirabilota bacterium]|nr:hypothetical protein [Methylomirabilota bacterium]